jgi:hypothetical protein
LTDLARFTVSAWIKPRGFGEVNLGRIVNKRNPAGTAGWTLFLTGKGSALFRQAFNVAGGGWITPINSVTLNTWQHVAVTYDSASTANRPIFYINGKLVTTSVADSPSGSKNSDSATPLSIGNTSTLDRTFNGAIDDVRIYNRILGATEIEALAAVMPTGAG